MQYTLSYSLSNLQLLIKETYSYDKNGNRTAKQTAFGIIEYNYDKENKLISSGSHGQTFVNYTYDKKGNLISEDSAEKSINYCYNTQNRLICCEITGKEKLTYTQTSYAYDALGRRIIVQDFDNAPLRTIYDSFTFDAIKQGTSFVNGTFTDSYEAGVRWSTTGNPTGERYRYISDDDNYKASSSRYYGNRTQLFVNNKIAAQASADGQTEYFTTDILGSIRSTTDIYGSAKQKLNYNAFGTLIQGELSGRADSGFSGKSFDPTSKIYNYGYRDYNPALASFTTSDPIRDGFNWFTYCNGDPVNFVDLWGDRVKNTGTLEQQTSKNSIGGTKSSIAKEGCVLTAYVRIAQALSNKEITLDEANKIATKNLLYTNGNELSIENGVKLINKLIKGSGKEIVYSGSLTGTTTEIAKQINQLEASELNYFLTARINTTNADATEKYEHTVNINSNSVFANDITDMENSLNIRINDTSNAGRKAVENDVRENEILRVDYFTVKRKKTK